MSWVNPYGLAFTSIDELDPARIGRVQLSQADGPINAFFKEVYYSFEDDRTKVELAVDINKVNSAEFIARSGVQMHIPIEFPDGRKILHGMLTMASQEVGESTVQLELEFKGRWWTDGPQQPA